MKYEIPAEWIEYDNLLLQGMKEAEACIKKLVEPIVDNEHDFEWIRWVFLTSTVRHHCFRYKNNIYSVLVGFLDGEDLFLPQCYIISHRKICQEEGVIPCICLLDKKTLQPCHPDFYLVDSRMMRPITIKAGEETPMKQWEIVEKAYKFVRTHLLHNGCQILAGAGDLKAPQILFKDENDVNSYVIVKAHYTNEIVQLSKKRIMGKYQGYYADLIIDGVPGTQMRNQPVNFIFKGLEPIEKKVEDGIFIDPPTI